MAQKDISPNPPRPRKSHHVQVPFCFGRHRFRSDSRRADHFTRCTRRRIGSSQGHQRGVIDPDYTSLWGGTPNTMTPAELMTAWRGIVPGFDATWHELSDVRARVSGNTATATAAVDGRHWLGDALWRPIGSYEWDLEKRNGQWKVTRMVFKMTREIGDRGLAAQAIERAKLVSAAAR
jgi:hypothetical protein